MLLLAVTSIATVEASMFSIANRLHHHQSQLATADDKTTDDTSNSVHDDDEEDDEDIKDDTTSANVKYYMNGVRGSWTGFMKGFYKDSKIELSERCISSSLTDNMHFIISFAEGKEPAYKVAKFVTTIAKAFTDNLSHCGYEKLVADLKAFCATGDNICQPNHLLKNITDKTFSFIGDVNGIISAV